MQVSQPCLRLFSEVSDHIWANRYAKDYRIGYLAQDLDGVSSLSVLEETKKALKVIQDLEQEINDIVQRLETTTDVSSDAYMRMLDDLNDKQIQLDSMGADHTEERIERVLKGLGFESIWQNR